MQLPKWVVDIDALVAGERLVLRHAVAVGGEDGGERGEVVDDEGRVRLAGGDEGGADAKMDLEPARLGPIAAARGEVGQRSAPDWAPAYAGEIGGWAGRRAVPSLRENSEGGNEA